MQKFNIKLNIAGKSYALSIEREKEAIFRRAEKEVNRLTAAVESQYMAEREDYLAVVALQLAVRAVGHPQCKHGCRSKPQSGFWTTFVGATRKAGFSPFAPPSSKSFENGRNGRKRNPPD